MGCTSVSNDNTIEILYNPLTITKAYSQILDNANNRWDFYADTDSLMIPFTIEQVNRAILDAKNRGIRFRFITDIKKDNITFCKDSVLKVAELRNRSMCAHIKEVLCVHHIRDLIHAIKDITTRTITSVVFMAALILNIHVMIIRTH
jgi:hypothetical protein